METGAGGDDMGTEEEGSGREAARCVSEAFRCQGANLLPDTKFIGNGLFIKYLGQVDLPGAPLYIAHRHMAPRPLSHTLPGFGCRQDMEWLFVGDGVVVFWGGGCLRGFKDSVF